MLDSTAAKAQASLLDAWQRSLPLIDESLRGDRLVDVVDIRAHKTVVITAKHVALLKVCLLLDLVSHIHIVHQSSTQTTTAAGGSRWCSGVPQAVARAHCTGAERIG